MVVGRASGSLNSHVRAEVEIVLPRMSHIVLDQCTWHRIAVLISSHALGREKADVVALLGHHDSHLWLSYVLATSTKYDRAQVIPGCRGLADPSHP